MLSRLKSAVLVLATLSSLVASAMVAPVSAQTSVTQRSIDNNLCAGSNLDFNGSSSGNCNTIEASNTITDLVHNLINLLSLVVGIVAVIMIIVGGLRYITSGGNDASVTGAKNTILYAVVGLVIVALAQIMVHFVISKVSNS